MAPNTVPPSVVRASALTTVTNILSIVNAVEPDIAALIALLKDSTATAEKLLADADTVEQAEIAKLKAELGIQ